jgi:clathrin heavy chain
MIALASKLATHELLEFRRISAYVYRNNKKWNQSIELSKNDRMWKDCVDTANESQDDEIVENLLRFFCETSEKECFAACLYTCFTHISPDLVLELGWIHGYHNFIMPFIIQTFRKTHVRLKALEKRTAPPEEDDKMQDMVASTYGNLAGFGAGVLMLENGGPSFGGTSIPGGIPMPGTPGMGSANIDMSGFGIGNPQMNGGMGGPGMGMPGMMPGMGY